MAPVTARNCEEGGENPDRDDRGHRASPENAIAREGLGPKLKPPDERPVHKPGDTDRDEHDDGRDDHALDPLRLHQAVFASFRVKTFKVAGIVLSP